MAKQEKTRKNYKSGFDFLLGLTDCGGKPARIPECDWYAYFYTADPYKRIKASCISGVYTNCFRDGDKLHFVFDHTHGLLPGELHWEPHFDIPNDIYPNGYQHICWPETLGIELVRGRGDCATETVVEVMAPYIKGEPFTYDDFTPEQIAELQKPATDAAASVSELETNIQETEALRKDAEQTRISNENSRTSAENDRVRDENIRKANETSRQSNETARVEAETARAEEFAAWQGEIDSKADRSELSNVLAEEPLTPENFPDINTYTREELKKDLFIDMWNNACSNNGSYDPDNAPDAEHPFLLNGLWMTYEEALVCYRESSGANYLYDYCHAFSTARTFLPVRNSRGSWGNNSYYAFARCANLEVLDFDNSVYVGISSNSFSSCIKLREIRNGKLITNANSKDALNLPNLESFTVRINSDFNLSNASKVTYDSIEYMVSNAINTSPITITLHPNVYSQLTDEIIASASEKNITFATV